MTDIAQAMPSVITPPWRDWRVGVGALFLAAFVLHLATPLASDTAWLLTVGERMLDGQTLYRDINEINPPMSAWLYLPEVVAARATGVPPDFAVIVIVFGLAFAAISIGGAILRRAGLYAGGATWWTTLALALVAAPMLTFSQREHFAAILAIPMIAAIAVGASKTPLTIAERLVAGAFGGLMVAIKPHFALALFFSVAAAAIAPRSLRPVLAAENIIAAIVAAAFAGASILAYPDYLTRVMSLAGAIYLPNRLSLTDLLLKPHAFLCVLAVAAIVARGGAWRDPVLRTLLTASAGFGLAYLIQGKGWSYHLLPAMTLLTAGLGLSIARGAVTASGPAASFTRSLTAIAVAALVAAPLGEAGLRIWFERNVLANLVAPHLPKGEGRRPTLLLLDDSVALGSPLHRTVDAVLVNRGPSLWMAGAAYELCARDPSEERRAVCRDAIERERADLSDDLRRQPPDVIVTGHTNIDWLAWAKRDPKIATLLEGYRVVEDYDSWFNKIRVLARTHVQGS